MPNSLNSYQTDCEPFHAPFDIEIRRDEKEEAKIVIPDLSVICDKGGFDEQKYVGVPPLLIEIVSPSNQSYDMVTKLNLCMEYGVNEYWIVNPLLNTVQVSTLGENGKYQQAVVAKDHGTLHSIEFPDFKVNIETLFK